MTMLVQDLANFNDIAKEIHAGNAHWWADLETGERVERNKDQMLMLIVSEIAEAMEGERKNLMDDKLPHRKMVEVELADVLIRVFDFAGGFNYDMDMHVAAEMTRLECTDNAGEMLFALVRRVYMVWLAIRMGDGHITVGGRLAWLVIGVLQYCDHFGYDVFSAMEEKLDYNRVRADHKDENRKKVNGKKW